MSDRKLADRAVALGVGKKLDSIYYSWGQQSDKFVRDWRVAGALMEKVPTIELAQLVNSQGWAAQAADEDCLYTEVRNESAPRAIIEACVEALETNDE